MLSLVNNILVFAVYVLALIVEFVLTYAFNLSYSTFWLITTLIYIIFIAYQVLARASEYLEKGKVKEILFSIMDSINGIPLVNKAGKIVIQWDVVFKKLIDKKNYELYDSIIKTKTKTIDHYVNQYPSLLFDSSTDMIERNNKIDTKSLITGSKSKDKEKDNVPEISEEIKNALFVKYISSDKITYANFDSSIYVDVLINNEYEPPNYEENGADRDDRYDGFSVVAFYKDGRYSIVPRTMVFGKRIDKEKWLYRNVDRIKECIESITAGEQSYKIIVDELSLKDSLTDYVEEEKEKIPSFHFECVQDSMLIFSSFDNGKEFARAYCSFDTNRGGYEIRLKKYEIIIGGVGKVVEEDRTIAIGNAYQPLLAVMEKMQIITRNLAMAISQKDIDELVLK